jgi:Nucleotidyltransferase domain
MYPGSCTSTSSRRVQSQPYGRLRVGSRAASSSLMADGMWRLAGTRVRRTCAPDLRGPSRASACWQAYKVREGVIDNRKLTPYRGLDEVLLDYAHTSRAVLGDNFVGLYLLGSLAIGDFDLTSDVDFMIVTSRELSRDQVELVESAHTKLIARDSRWVKHLEYSIFPRQKLSEKSSPYGPNGRDDSAARQLWYFNNGRLGDREV